MVCIFRKSQKPRRPAAPRQVRPQLEILETRLVPYALSGASWVHPQLVTISFVPDGTVVGVNGNGPVVSNLFAAMNARFGSPSVWEDQILLAAQSWAAQTNLNFAVVPDNGSPIGQGAYQQGDPGMGDIRISGYVFTLNYLGTAYMPPQINNYSIAGDIQLNTGVVWNIGSSFDLYTAAAHEFGHALGLYHSTTDSSALMWAYYDGTKTGPSADDIAGIRAIYSGGAARTPDWYGLYAPNHTWQTAAGVWINPFSLTGQVTNMDITNPGETDWYAFTVPLFTNGTVQVQVQSTGLSMLQPVVSAYANGYSLGTVSGAGQLGGSTLNLTYTGVYPLEVVYVAVSGANTTPLGTGAYALTLDLGNNPLPAVPLPYTTTPNGNPLQGGGIQGLGQMLGNAVAGISPALASFLVNTLGMTATTINSLALGQADALAINSQAHFYLASLGCDCPLCRAALQKALASANPMSVISAVLPGQDGAALPATATVDMASMTSWLVSALNSNSGSASDTTATLPGTTGQASALPDLPDGLSWAQLSSAFFASWGTPQGNSS